MYRKGPPEANKIADVSVNFAGPSLSELPESIPARWWFGFDTILKNVDEDGVRKWCEDLAIDLCRVGM